jgi:Kef-type K+ transport system membrane component KefB
MEASKIQAFAAGAALSATSLGTAFTVISSSKSVALLHSRARTILISAALIDDVAGLVMVHVIFSLGKPSNLVEAIARPVGASAGVLLLAVFEYWCLPKVPIIKLLFKSSPVDDKAAIVSLHALLFFQFIVCANYAGASTLLAAFVTGAGATYLDGRLVNLPFFQFRVFL